MTDKKTLYETYISSEENKNIIEEICKEQPEEHVHNFLKLIFNKVEEVYIKPIQQIKDNNKP
jgi:F0F1-type ATP synthase delta subunit